ncbi:hypothetical protein DPEC_G00315050 [Dallia pectoralis]|uniref:Uncharacterized protein n=1 Tax=Dallia pectoralis TaxID=75939 RepID=A0ACC2FCB8_DALPE|nr:hypothetical protein DPEC_G00315050 [Dallia pectoralis]
MGVRWAPLWLDWAVWEHKVAFSRLSVRMGGLASGVWTGRADTGPRRSEEGVCGGGRWQTPWAVPTQRHQDEGAFLSHSEHRMVSVLKQDLKKPQPLLESIRAPDPPPPPWWCEETEERLRRKRGGQRILCY